jgi:hypothetical protein
MSRGAVRVRPGAHVQPGLVALVPVATTAKRLKRVHVVELPCAHESGIGAAGG